MPPGPLKCFSRKLFISDRGKVFSCGVAIWAHTRHLGAPCTRGMLVAMAVVWRAGLPQYRECGVAVWRRVAVVEGSADPGLEHLRQEILQPRMLGMREELLRGILLLDLPVVHEADPGPHLPCEAHFVGDHHHRHARVGQFLH